MGPEILKRVLYKLHHVHLQVVSHPKANTDIGYLCTKFDDSSFSHYRDMSGTEPQKIKMGHMTLSRPL